MMISRVTLLLLVTGMFAGMWSGDRSAERAAHQRMLARKQQATSKSVASRQAVPMRIRTTAATVPPVIRPLAVRSASSIPLPQGIAVGTYLVVDARGRSETRVVTATEAFPNGRISRHFAADQYTVRVGRERWHFIRLEEATSSKPIRRETPVSHAAPMHGASLR